MRSPLVRISQHQGADTGLTIGVFGQLEFLTELVASTPWRAKSLRRAMVIGLTRRISINPPAPSSSLGMEGAENLSDLHHRISLLQRSIFCARSIGPAPRARCLGSCGPRRASRGWSACRVQRREARQLLQSVYDRFTQGFSASDLKRARKLLDELHAAPAA